MSHLERGLGGVQPASSGVDLQRPRRVQADPPGTNVHEPPCPYIIFSVRVALRPADPPAGFFFGIHSSPASAGPRPAPNRGYRNAQAVSNLPDVQIAIVSTITERSGGIVCYVGFVLLQL